MHSERIDHQISMKPTSRVLTRRRLLGAAGALFAGIALTGCGSGTSGEAARGREQDANNDSVLKNMQATETWKIVNATPPPGTPTPGGE